MTDVTTIFKEEMTMISKRFLVQALNLAILAVSACSQDGQPMPSEERNSTSKELQSACMQAREQLINDVFNIVTQHQLACFRDSDCVLVDTTIPCQQNCPLAVHVSKRTLFQASLGSYAGRACAATPRNCGISPLCAPSTTAQCVAGKCAPRFASSRSR